MPLQLDSSHACVRARSRHRFSRRDSPWGPAIHSPLAPLRRSRCAPTRRSRRVSNAPASTDTTVAQQRVTIEGHYDNSLGSSDAASQGTIRAELLKSRPPQRPGEVLEFVPGVIVTQHSGDGKANQYFLRGFNLDHGTDFATFVGGMPVNMPTHGHGQGYTDLNFLIPELVQRIEYRKGPYFASDGDFAAAGSAEIVYRTKFDAPFGLLTLGENGYRRGVLGGSIDLANQTTLLGVFEAMRNDGPWTLDENLKRHNGVLTYSGGTQAQGWSLTGMGYDANWRSTDQIPQRLIDAGTLDPTTVRPLRCDRHQRRRRHVALQPVGRMASQRRRPAHARVGLRHALQAAAVLQLHLLHHARRRPVPAERRPQDGRPARQPRLRAQARHARRAQRGRPAAAARPHPRGPVRHRVARDREHHARRQRARDAGRRVRADQRGVHAGAACDRRRSCRPCAQRGRQHCHAGQLGQGQRHAGLAEAEPDRRAVREDRVVLQRWPRLPQQRRTRHHRRIGARRRRWSKPKATRSACAPKRSPACRVRSRCGA